MALPRALRLLLPRFGGGYVDQNFGTRSRLDSAGGVAAGSLLHQTVRDGVATSYWNGYQTYLNSQPPVVMALEDRYPFTTLVNYRGLKRDYYLMRAGHTAVLRS